MMNRLMPLLEFSIYTLIFLLIGIIFHRLVQFAFHRRLQRCFLDLSMAFMVSGLFNQNSILAVYYGYYYAIFFHILELFLFSLLSLYGLENPLDNVCRIANKYWDGLLSIPFQILGAFIAANMSLFLWNLRYKNHPSNKPNVSEQSFLSPASLDSFCEETVKANAIEGFYLEFLGSLVRLVLKVWKMSQNKWKNEMLVIAMQIVLKIQGYMYALSYCFGLFSHQL